jgi:hypothetical protein
MVMAVLNSLIIYKIAMLFTPATDMMAELTALTEAENIALESYLQTKAMYLFNDGLSYRASMRETMGMITTTEIQFAAASRSIEKTITIVGGSFADNLNKILIGDVCNLTSSQMPSLLLHCESMHYGAM